jgi:hypothetical protein
MALEAVRDVAFGVHQKIAWQADNPLIRAATGRGRQLWGGSIRDVDADNGKITAFKLPNVRATPATDSMGSVFVRVRTNAFKKHNRFVLISEQFILLR